MSNHCVIGIPLSSLAEVMAALIAKGITTDMHVGGSAVAVIYFIINFFFVII